MRKIACQNLKGGTGKTTTVVSLASCLASKNKKILVLDVDVQGNIKESFGIDHKLTIYDLLINDTYKEKVFPVVRLDTKIKQASSANQTIFEVDKQSRGAEDYNQICEVLLDEKKSVKEYTKTG